VACAAARGSIERVGNMRAKPSLISSAFKPSALSNRIVVAPYSAAALPMALPRQGAR